MAVSGVRHAWRCERGHVHTDYAAALQCGPKPTNITPWVSRCASGHLHATAALALECEQSRVWRRAKELGLEPRPLAKLVPDPKGVQTDLFGEAESGVK